MLWVGFEELQRLKASGFYPVRREHRGRRMRVRVPVQVRVHVFLEVFDEGPGEDGCSRMIEVRRPCSRQYSMLRLS